MSHTNQQQQPPATYLSRASGAVVGFFVNPIRDLSGTTLRTLLALGMLGTVTIGAPVVAGLLYYFKSGILAAALATILAATVATAIVGLGAAVLSIAVPLVALYELVVSPFKGMIRGWKLGLSSFLDGRFYKEDKPVFEATIVQQLKIAAAKMHQALQGELASLQRPHSPANQPQSANRTNGTASTARANSSTPVGTATTTSVTRASSMTSPSSVVRPQNNAADVPELQASRVTVYPVEASGASDTSNNSSHSNSSRPSVAANANSFLAASIRRTASQESLTDGDTEEFDADGDTNVPRAVDSSISPQ